MRRYKKRFASCLRSLNSTAQHLPWSVTSPPIICVFLSDSGEALALANSRGSLCVQGACLIYSTIPGMRERMCMAEHRPGGRACLEKLLASKDTPIVLHKR